jgi:CRISPR/Cas system-associated endoribonuclease Cas2
MGITILMPNATLQLDVNRADADRKLGARVARAQKISNAEIRTIRTGNDAFLSAAWVGRNTRSGEVEAIT